MGIHGGSGKLDQRVDWKGSAIALPDCPVRAAEWENSQAQRSDLSGSEPFHRPDEAGPVCLGGPDAGILYGGQQLPGLLPGAAGKDHFSQRHESQGKGCV